MILICILNRYNLIQFIWASCLRMLFYANWLMQPAIAWQYRPDILEYMYGCQVNIVKL